MDPENHAFFVGVIRDFEPWYKLTKRVAEQVDSLRNKLVEYENKAIHAENEYNKKKADIEALDRQLRDKRLLLSASGKQVSDDLERRRQEVAEREATIKVREGHLREQQAQLDRLLAAAEAKESVKEAEAKKKPAPAMARK